MEYKLIRGSNEQDVVNKVCDSIDCGWIPCGGIAIRTSLSLGDIYFYQAMTRSKKVESSPTDTQQTNGGASLNG